MLPSAAFSRRSNWNDRRSSCARRPTPLARRDCKRCQPRSTRASRAGDNHTPPMEKNMIQLGQKVKDKITGFTGIVTGYVTYITGCNQALFAPQVGQDGAIKDACWFDEQRLVVDRKFKRKIGKA